jgi:hypothetical protein
MFKQNQPVSRSGGHTPLARGFWRPAENFVHQIIPAAKN